MTTARKPVQSPKPAITRAPAKTHPEPRNPITVEIMQRVRRVIVDSRGEISTTSIADELGFNRSQFAEWTRCFRATPGGDNLVAIVIWLIPRDPTFYKEVLAAKKIKFRGEVERLSTVPDDVREKIRRPQYRKGLINELAKEHNLGRHAVSKIRNDSH